MATQVVWDTEAFSTAVFWAFTAIPEVLSTPADGGFLLAHLQSFSVCPFPSPTTISLFVGVSQSSPQVFGTSSVFFFCATIIKISWTAQFVRNKNISPSFEGCRVQGHSSRLGIGWRLLLAPQKTSAGLFPNGPRDKKKQTLSAAALPDLGPQRPFFLAPPQRG